MTHRLLRPVVLAATALTLHTIPGHAAGNANQTPDCGQLIGLSGTVPNFDKVDISSPNVYDYTFASAPTDWRVQSGVWEMTNRWACSPGWSWFGGRSDETAAIWNKRKFTGDVSVQFYFAFKMGVAGGWPEYPADMGVTIGGDGQNLASGYALVIGADGNAHSVLRKGATVVAENHGAEALLPNENDGNPDAGHEWAIVHRRWWYVRIDKVGSKVSCYLDNKPLFTYNDPKPLDTGQIALWTYNNGIMLSRVQVYYQNEVHAPFTRLAKAPVKVVSPVRSAKAASTSKGAAPVKMAMRP